MPRNSGSGNSHLAEPRWSVEFLDDRVEAEFDAFPAELQADFVHIAEMIQEVGLHAIGYPHVRHVREKLWEMRTRGKDGIGRELYCTAKGRRVIILRCFTKKANKTPQKEIEIAAERMKQLT
ncbi:type II toxin-antitoxin system RelE/ParE family toxin [Desulfolutivibrio sulfoxidireducens]|uniref:type II toxin-antitoxin system RelE/ParE family toxin n=1 Tax=Desulfolutivibrio sulfoxidireducens TaxID=2773299 RepID=UPI00159E8853|nr:type II toxin-antitoxin system RelE/ParE family toxin [Desulfolutivibrio sulfoxidireducens]QLA17933.1 type II toxin-antitoxin system RelE/ParE family toxin [Desulfolutivibrio sulfoxidireducens]QLA21510.1 type II toxin-antitoxin system RelE/ParE family toxin [Desulfolutivibrio sulfoxidireducens]